MIAESWAELRPMQTQLHGGAGLSGARTACTSAPAPITTSWPEHSWRVTDEAANNHARQRRAIALWVQACPLVAGTLRSPSFGGRQNRLGWDVLNRRQLRERRVACIFVFFVSFCGFAGVHSTVG